MTRVFVCEYLSGGGLGAAEAQAARGDAGGLLAQGLAMRDALLGDLTALSGIELSYAMGTGVPTWRAQEGAGIHGSASAQAGPGAPIAGRRATGVAARPDESFADFVRRQSLRHDFTWVVAPETGDCLAALAEIVEVGRWIGCARSAIALAGSKRATTDRLAACGIATPRAFELAAAQAARWVVKPDDGAGACDTVVHASRGAALSDAKARAARGGAAIIEPWVDGEALSLSLLADGHGGGELLAVNRQRIEVDAVSGVVAYRGVDVAAIDAGDARHAQLRACAAALLRALPGLAGFVGADVVWHASRGPVVIEINPRLTCAYVGLSAKLGRNVAGEVLLRHRRQSDDRGRAMHAAERRDAAA